MFKGIWEGIVAIAKAIPQLINLFKKTEAEKITENELSAQEKKEKMQKTGRPVE